MAADAWACMSAVTARKSTSCMSVLLPARLIAQCRSKEESDGMHDKLEKVVVFGGGSFGTAMGVSLARQKKDMQARWGMGVRYL